jgi:hypothetical protein
MHIRETCLKSHHGCCDVAVTQINYHSLNKQDSREQVRGRFHDEDLVQIFMLDDMQLVLKLSRL